MVYWSWGFLNRTGKCHCVRESSGLSGFRAGVKRNCSSSSPCGRAVPAGAVSSRRRLVFVYLLMNST